MQDEPELVRGDTFYIIAFWELSTTRDFGGGVMGPIPWHWINHYGERKSLNAAMMGVFTVVIRELDEAYLGWQRDEQKKRAEQK